MKQILVTLALIFNFSLAMAGSTGAKQEIQLQVTEKGFEPSQISVKPDTSVVLKVTRKTDSTCATVIQIPSQKIKQDLPLNKTVSIDLGKLPKGKLRFACGMDMVSGYLVVE